MLTAAGVTAAMLDRTKLERVRMGQIGPTALHEVVVGLAVDDLANCAGISSGRRAEVAADFTRGISADRGPEEGARRASAYVAYLADEYCPLVRLTPDVRAGLGLS